MRRRLGVSPGPVGVERAADGDASRRAARRPSRPGRSVEQNGCSSVGGSAPVFCRNVTPIARGPAFTGTRTCSRASMIFTALSGPISDVW